MTKTKLFCLSLLLTVAGMLGYFYTNRPKPLGPEPKLVEISDGVFLTSQLNPQDVARLERRGIRHIVAMRPDGEAEDQPSSAEIANAVAKARSMKFYYIPVPHESIPEAAVIALQQAQQEAEGSMLIYCRTGRRAVRLFALTEASRNGGPGIEAILDMVKNAGFSAEDLREAMEQRIAVRYGKQGGSKP